MEIVLFGALYDALPLIPLAIGLVWTLRYQKVADLSLAGSFSIAAGATAALLHSGHGTVLGLTCGIAVGVAIGCLMGFAVNILRIDALMSGLIVLFIAYAVSLGITEGTVGVPTESNPIDYLSALERDSGLAPWAHPYLNTLFFTFAALVVIGAHALLSSEWGCAYRALEDEDAGRTFLRSVGISPGRMSTAGFVLAATAASLSGILVALRDGQATSSLGLDSLVEVIPAYLLGGALLEKQPSLRGQVGGRETPLGRVGRLLRDYTSMVKIAPPSVAAGLGVLLYFVVVNLAQRWTGVPWLPRVFIGVTILLALGGAPAWNRWRRSRHQRQATETKSSTSPLEIRNLTVSYPTINGQFEVLSSIDVSAAPGTILQIAGTNGSGKTTLLKALTDEVDSTGSFSIPVAVEGDAPDSWFTRAELVAFVPQQAATATAGSLSIAEHAAITWAGRSPSPLRSWRRAAREAVPRLDIDDVTKNPESLLKWLSGGQVRRVVLGLLHARQHRPVVVAMDEPFTYLDDEGQRRCRAIVKGHADAGGIVMIVDHQSHMHVDDVTTVGKDPRNEEVSFGGS